MGPENLNRYIKEVMNKPFEWRVHDCFLFSNKAFKLYHGFGYADKWVEPYKKKKGPLTKSNLKKDFGFNSFEEVIEKSLIEIEYLAPRGSLVATEKAKRGSIGYSLGISLGIKSAFVCEKGLVFIPTKSVCKSWIPA